MEKNVGVILNPCSQRPAKSRAIEWHLHQNWNRKLVSLISPVLKEILLPVSFIYYRHHHYHHYYSNILSRVILLRKRRRGILHSDKRVIFCVWIWSLCGLK